MFVVNNNKKISSDVIVMYIDENYKLVDSKSQKSDEKSDVIKRVMLSYKTGVQL